jgi:hypothetical protein
LLRRKLRAFTLPSLSLSGTLSRNCISKLWFGQFLSKRDGCASTHHWLFVTVTMAQLTHGFPSPDYLGTRMSVPQSSIWLLCSSTLPGFGICGYPCWGKTFSNTLLTSKLPSTIYFTTLMPG